MLVLCAGMFRSASTWQYQVVGEVARRAGVKFVLHGVLPVSEIQNRVPAALDSMTWHVFKTHVADDWMAQHFHHPGFRVLYSYRDIRDVVYSMMHKTGFTYRGVIDRWNVVEGCKLVDRLWPQVPRRVEQRYEDWLADSAAWVSRIGDCLDRPVTESAAREIADLYSLPKQRRRVDRITANFRQHGVDLADRRNVLQYDPESLLHWNHFREGRVGHWMSLATPRERIELHRLCGEWLVQRGYETDSSWAFGRLIPHAIQ